MNEVFLAGALGQDPEIKYYDSGSIKCSASICINEQYKEQTCSTWINLELWGISAEKLSSIARKGDALIVKGKVRTSSYTDANDNKKTRTYVSVDWFRVIPKIEKLQDNRYGTEEAVL